MCIRYWVKILKKTLREKYVRLIQVMKELTTIKAQVANKDKVPAEEAEVGNIDSEDWELKYHCLLALVKKRGFVIGDPFSGNDQLDS